MKQAEKFLKKKTQVKVTVVMYGRQLNHPERGFVMLQKVMEALKDFGTPANKPTPKNMSLVFNPKK